MARLVKLGARIRIEPGAGASLGLADDAFQGASIGTDRDAMLADADVVIGVQPPSVETVHQMHEGAILVSYLYADREPELVQCLLERKVTCFAMDRIPRTTRAEAMDARSSQSALEGYYAVILGAQHLGRILPKITTAAGAVGPAKVLVMGLGVAGLEAIATAHRLGAIVEGYDVRPETHEQALSLGAKFVETGVNASGKDGYARELTPEENAKVSAALTQHIQQADLVITTAAVPGRPSPKLISHAQLAGMKTGAVIVDLAAEGGGNCEDTTPGETRKIGGVTIVAPFNVPSLLAEDASALYAHNVYSLLALFVKENVVEIDWADDVLARTVLTHAGERKDGQVKPAGSGLPRSTSQGDHVGLASAR